LSQNNSAILDFFSKFPNQPFEFVTVTDINIKEHPNYYKAIFKNIKTNKFHAQLIAPEMMRYKYKVGHIYTDGEHVGQNKTLLKGELTVNENIDVNLVRLSTVLSEEEAKNIIDYEDVTKYLLRQYAHVDSVFSFKHDTHTHDVFYRGHSDKQKYKLEPSLFRKDELGNYLYLEKEDILYRELIVSNSSDFLSDSYTLDRLVRMQHYSLPTRLLDITSNPLIALYFTCKSSEESNGEVIFFKIQKDEIKYYDSDTASCLANLAKLPKHEQNKINTGLEKHEFNEQPVIKRLVHFIREEKPFFEAQIEPNDLKKVICVKSKKSNERITSQSGAFLLFGIDAALNEQGTENIQIYRITIKKESKQKILAELDLLNINESSVFPYIENSAKYVAQKYKFKK